MSENHRKARKPIVWDLSDSNKLEVTSVPHENPTAKIPGTVRLVCMSDTHGYTPDANFPVPDGDIFIHAGDFSNNKDPKSLRSVVKEFNTWLGKLPHLHKLVIAGNHEVTLSRPSTILEFKSLKHYLTNCIYLEDSGVEICNLRFWGTPWRRQLGVSEKWKRIPSSIDILISHGPPAQIGDLCKTGQHVGCPGLLSTIQKRLNLKLHIFGHIHEARGVYKAKGIETTFANVSLCNVSYCPVNSLLVFDVKIPGI